MNEHGKQWRIAAAFAAALVIASESALAVGPLVSANAHVSVYGACEPNVLSDYYYEDAWINLAVDEEIDFSGIRSVSGSAEAHDNCQSETKSVQPVGATGESRSYLNDLEVETYCSASSTGAGPFCGSIPRDCANAGSETGASGQVGGYIVAGYEGQPPGQPVTVGYTVYLKTYSDESWYEDSTLVDTDGWYGTYVLVEFGPWFYMTSCTKYWDGYGHKTYLYLAYDGELYEAYIEPNETGITLNFEVEVQSGDIWGYTLEANSQVVIGTYDGDHGTVSAMGCAEANISITNAYVQY